MSGGDILQHYLEILNECFLGTICEVSSSVFLILQWHTSVLPVSNGLNLFFQCLWRCYAAEPRSSFHATWRIHIQEHRHHQNNALSKVARRASVMKKRRFSKQRLDLSVLGNHTSSGTVERKESDGSVTFLPNERRASMSGKWDHYELEWVS